MYIESLCHGWYNKTAVIYSFSIKHIVGGKKMLNKLLMKINSKSVAFKWILSYLLLIIFFIGSMAISIGYFYSTYKTEIIRSNEYILDIVEEEYGYVFEDIKSVINRSLIQSHNIYSDIPTDSNDAAKEYKFSLIMNQLNQLVQSKELYEHVYVYLQDYDVIISTKNVMDTDLFFKAYIEKTGMGYNEWIDTISNDTHNSIVPKVTNAGEDKYYYVCKTVISLMTRNENVSMVFVLNGNYIYDINEKIYGASGADVLMNDGKAIVNFSKKFNTQSFTTADVYNDCGVSYVKIDGKKYIYMATDNFASNNYILIIPMQTFYNNLTNILGMQFVMLLIISLTMVALSIWFSKLHLSPVKELMQLLSNKSEISSKNEYDEISNRISDMIFEKNAIEKKLAGHNKYLYQNVITRWLKGEIKPKSFEQFNVDLGKLGFVNSKYIVLAFEITDVDDVLNDEDENNDYEIAKFALNNVISELINKKYYCYSIDVDGLLTCIVNPDVDSSDEKIKKDLLEIYNYAKEFISKNLDFNFKMSMGNIRNDAEELHYSYNEAVSLLEYNLAYGDNVVFTDEADALSQNMLGMLYTETNKLAHSIKDNNFDSTDALIEKWSKLYITCRATSPNAMQYGLYSLMDAILRECVMLNASNEEASSFVEYLAGKYRFENTKSYENIKSKLTDMFFEIREFVDDKAGINHLEDRIMKYIEENYSDSELSVAKIADHFNLNVAYLSSVFKKITNCGMLEKINKLRCDKSAQLLLGTRKKISDIAEEVGYMNVHTYIRVFKKYYFITPTQYRMQKGKR